MTGGVGRFLRVVRKIPFPLRIVLGFVFIAGGLVGFLPVLGFWMVPLGLAILSVDMPFARRAWRRMYVFIGRKAERFRDWRAE